MIRSCDNEIQSPFTPKAARLRRASCPVVAYRRVGIFKNATMKPTAKSKTQEYSIWEGIKNRCLNPNADSYKNYGGRGITICDRWMTFENFLEDMGVRPSKKHSIDRKNNNGNYHPDNCVWATVSEQNSNRRGNVILCFNGERKTLTRWAKDAGVHPNTFFSRFYRGQTIDQILSAKVRKQSPLGRRAHSELRGMISSLEESLSRSNQLLTQMLVLAEHDGKICKDSLLADAIRAQITKAQGLLR